MIGLNLPWSPRPQSSLTSRPTLPFVSPLSSHSLLFTFGISAFFLSFFPLPIYLFPPTLAGHDGKLPGAPSVSPGDRELKLLRWRPHLQPLRKWMCQSWPYLLSSQPLLYEEGDVSGKKRHTHRNKHTHTNAACVTAEMWGGKYTATAAAVWLQIKVTSWGHYLSSTAAKGLQILYLLSPHNSSRLEAACSRTNNVHANERVQNKVLHSRAPAHAQKFTQVPREHARRHTPGHLASLS